MRCSNNNYGHNRNSFIIQDNIENFMQHYPQINNIFIFTDRLMNFFLNKLATKILSLFFIIVDYSTKVIE